MNTTTFGFGQIDWTGFKSVLMHTLTGAGIAIVLALIDTLSHHNWGNLEPMAIPFFVFITAFVKKSAETYTVTTPEPITTPVV
jgi:hypothetical protein